MKSLLMGQTSEKEYIGPILATLSCIALQSTMCNCAYITTELGLSSQMGLPSEKIVFIVIFCTVGFPLGCHLCCHLR